MRYCITEDIVWLIDWRGGLFVEYGVVWKE